MIFTQSPPRPYPTKRGPQAIGHRDHAMERCAALGERPPAGCETSQPYNVEHNENITTDLAADATPEAYVAL